MEQYFQKTLTCLVLHVCMLMCPDLWAEANRELAEKFTIEQMVEYKSLPSYSQAPSLKKLEEKGEIPPIGQRLPAEPFVWKTNVMVDGPGVYGDVLRRVYGAGTEGWNFAVGQIQGWGGTEAYRESLINIGMMWVMKEPAPVPNLARSWEWVDDGYTLIMKLVEGVRWSDGYEFTAEDVIFSYDHILDDKIPSWQTKSTFSFGGQVTELKQIDKYTVSWHFGIAYPVVAIYQMNERFPIVPAHILKQHHPKYNTSNSYNDYFNVTPSDALPVVSLGPYIPVRYKPGQQLIYVRNPYYFKVDEKGQQLPYFDAIQFTDARDWSIRTLNVLAGSADNTHVQKYDLQPVVLSAARKPNTHFKTHWGDWRVPHQINLNLSLHLGVKDKRDKALRKLFRKKQFRVALSHLIDRHGITNGVFPTPATKPWYGGYCEGSTMYDESMVVRYPYNPDEARQILAELGFEDIDNDGILNWPNNSEISGEELIIELRAGGESPEWVQLAEALVEPFRKEGGIDLRVKQTGRSASAERNAGYWEMEVSRDMSTNAPEIYPHSVGSMSDTTPWWHMSGPGGQRDLLPFEQEIATLLESTVTIRSSAKLKKVFGQVLKLYTENQYTIGIMQAKYLDAYAKRHKNYPADFPIQLYGWTEKNVPMEIRWAEKSDQLPTSNYLQMIPKLSDY